jgi:hypothetical protein
MSDQSRFDLSVLERAPKVPGKPRHKTREVQVGTRVFGGDNPIWVQSMTTTDTFDEDATVVAQTFAGYAAVALANAHLYNTTVTLARQMQAAMEGRAVIEQAKGIIMGARYCGADEAFRVLVTISQNTNSKLRDVAAALVARAEKSESDR